VTLFIPLRPEEPQKAQAELNRVNMLYHKRKEEYSKELDSYSLTVLRKCCNLIHKRVLVMLLAQSPPHGWFIKVEGQEI